LRYLTPPERIANRVVADEYAAVSAKVNALYGQRPELPASLRLPGRGQLRLCVTRA
jgi:hypothetical protein